MTIVDICNLALSHIGETAKVTALNDGSTQATLSGQFYFIARDSMLESRLWSFATTRAVLPSITSTVDSWLYAYLIPQEAANIFAVLPAGSTDDYEVLGVEVPQRYTIEMDSLGRRILYTNVLDAVVRYSLKTEDTTVYSALFTLALSWKLASLLAGPIIKGEAGALEAKRCLQMLSMALSEAAQADDHQRQIQPVHTPPWVAGR